MDKSFRDSKSDAIKQFIEDIVNTNQGFGDLPYAILVEFAEDIQREHGTLPNPLDPIWEQVMDLASTTIIDDPEDI